MKIRVVYKLYENGNFIDQFNSYDEALKVKHRKEKEANDNWLDLCYEIYEFTEYK